MYVIVIELHSFPFVVMEIWKGVAFVRSLYKEIARTNIEQDDRNFTDKSGNTLHDPLFTPRFDRQNSTFTFVAVLGCRKLSANIYLMMTNVV